MDYDELAPLFVGVSAEEGPVNLSTRVSADLARLVERIVDNADTPYKTRSEFVRDSIYHRAVNWDDQLRMEGKKPDNISAVLQKLHVLNTEVTTEILHKEVAEKMQRAAITMEPYIRSGEFVEGLKILEIYSKNALGMPSEYWRMCALTELFKQSLIQQLVSKVNVQNLPSHVRKGWRKSRGLPED